jgi:hypothetical protein
MSSSSSSVTGAFYSKPTGQPSPPEPDSVVDLGRPTKRYRTLYCTDVSTATLNGVPVPDTTELETLVDQLQYDVSASEADISALEAKTELDIGVISVEITDQGTRLDAVEDVTQYQTANSGGTRLDGELVVRANSSNNVAMIIEDGVGFDAGYFLTQCSNDVDVQTSFPSITTNGGLRVDKSITVGGGINGRTPVGGMFSGLSDSLILSGSSVASILPTSSVGSLTLLGGSIKVGDSYHLVVSGDILNGNKDDTLEITIGTSSGSVFVSGQVELEDTIDGHFEIEGDITFRSIGTNAVHVTNVDITFNKKTTKDFKGTRLIGTDVFDSAADQDVTVTAQFFSASAPVSQIVTRLMYVQQVY